MMNRFVAFGIDADATIGRKYFTDFSIWEPFDIEYDKI
jgi:hypothetical protein